MMTNIEPAPIREHYIAYMDLLGYKTFFIDYPDKVEEFLSFINAAIQNATDYIGKLNISPILSSLGNIEFKYKVFSDNILICLEALDESADQARLLVLLKLVADIQRNFIIRYGLFLRGGITKGPLSFNDSFVFGQGLIDAVILEEKIAKYPRIVINEAIYSQLNNIQLYSKEEADKVAEIDKRLNDNEVLTEAEKAMTFQFHCKETASIIMQNMIMKYVWQWQDGKYYLSYLSGLVDSISSSGGSIAVQLANMVKELSPSDYAFLSSGEERIDESLRAHKEWIERKLTRYGNYNDIQVPADVPVREGVMQKYIWSMTYHNDFCILFNKVDFGIYTRANFNKQYVMPTIEVIHEDKTGDENCPSTSDTPSTAELNNEA